MHIHKASSIERCNGQNAFKRPSTHAHHHHIHSERTNERTKKAVCGKCIAVFFDMKHMHYVIIVEWRLAKMRER